MPTTRRHLALFVALAGSALAPLALAQTQDGRALERNLRTGGRNEKFSQRASMRDEVNLRNALITGNVGGGKAFRGNVGYSAPDEFRGSLAGDSTFRFRRDSTSAGSLRGGEALRYQFSATSSAGGGLETFSRIGATGRAAVAAGPGNASSAYGATGTDAFRARPGTLRSTSAFVASQGLGAAVVGYEVTDTGYSAVTASPLLGVRRATQETSFANSNRVTTPGQRAVDDLRGAGGSTSLSQPLDASAITSDRVDLSAGEGVSTRVRTIADDLSDRLKTRTPTPRTGGQVLEPGKAPQAPGSPEAPDAPQAPGTPTPDGTPPDGAAPDRATPGTPNTRPNLDTNLDAAESDVQARLKVLREKLIPKGHRLTDKPEQTSDREPERVDRDGDGKPDEPLRGGIDQETLRLIREAGGRARQFIDPVTGKADPFAEHITLGQELLAQGKYFDAEERFARALQQRPGDPAAMAARMHAQMGAGLYLSAALNLRTLMAQHPELAGLRYTGSTIPAPDRLQSIVSDLRANVQRAKDAGATPGSADGLLIAYIGWQLGDSAMTREGLSVARTGLKLVPAGAPEPEAATLLDLLEGVWLAPDATK